MNNEAKKNLLEKYWSQGGWILEENKIFEGNEYKIDVFKYEKDDCYFAFTLNSLIDIMNIIYVNKEKQTPVIIIKKTEDGKYCMEFR